MTIVQPCDAGIDTPIEKNLCVPPPDSVVKALCVLIIHLALYPRSCYFSTL